MNNRWYIIGGGGLGDFMRSYLRDYYPWSQLKSLREHQPDAFVRAILCCHNEQAAEFIKYNPYVNEVIWEPWQLDGTDIFNKHRGDCHPVHIASSRLKLATEMPQIYLAPEEVSLVKELKAKKPYVVMHPFAGLGDRIAVKPSDYEPMADELIKKGYQVIVIGGTYTRKNQGGSHQMVEEFVPSKPGMLNLLGASSRVAASLAQSCDGFIGTHSCYVHIPWLMHIKTLLLVPPKLQQHLESGDANCWVTRKKLPFNKTLYIDPAQYSLEFLVNETKNYF